MFKNDNVLGDAFGPRCHNKIRSEHFKHFRSNKTRGGRHWENHQSNSWQDGILKTFPKGNGKPAEIHCNDPLKEPCKHKGWNRRPYYRRKSPTVIKKAI